MLVLAAVIDDEPGDERVDQQMERLNPKAQHAVRHTYKKRGHMGL